jgi:hypothetical protein
MCVFVFSMLGSVYSVLCASDSNSDSDSQIDRGNLAKSLAKSTTFFCPGVRSFVYHGVRVRVYLYRKAHEHMDMYLHRCGGGS